MINDLWNLRNNRKSIILHEKSHIYSLQYCHNFCSVFQKEILKNCCCSFILKAVYLFFICSCIIKHFHTCNCSEYTVTFYQCPYSALQWSIQPFEFKRIRADINIPWVYCLLGCVNCSIEHK